MMKRFKIEYIISFLAIVLVFFMLGIFCGRNSVRYERGAVVEAENPASPDTVDSREEQAASVSNGEKTRSETETAADQEESTGEAEDPESGAGPSAADRETDETALIDLNTATAEELEKLPGIGPVLAQRVVDYREEHGSFQTIEEILQVPGIGDGKFDAIQSLITVR